MDEWAEFGSHPSEWIAMKDTGCPVVSAARTTRADVIGWYCGVTRVREGEGNSLVVLADIPAAMF